AALEPLLVPLEAKITGRFGILVNAIRVRVLESRIPALRALPGVVRVQRVHRYRPDLESSLPWIGVPTAWAGTAGGLTGAGIRIGIIDSGIDYYHADFGGRGRATDHEDDDPKVIEPGSFPTTKVVGGTDFVGDDYDASDTAKDTPVPDPDPLDTKANGHGSHVAGIAAGLGVLAGGSTYTGAHNSKVDFSRFKIGPGVAPDAKLYALKVFGRSGSTEAVTDALDWAADPNDDGRTTDHLDVVNLSLGGDFGSYDAADVELKAVDRLARLGCVVVVSAGNAGDTHYILGNPGFAPRAITVANSIDNGTTTQDLRVLSPASIATNYPAVEGAVTVTAPLGDVGPKTAQVVATSPADACEPLSNTAALKGKIALIDRGDCLFADKIAKAQAAGAIGVIMVNNQDGPPIPMGGNTGDPATIPGVMVSQADGSLLHAHQSDGGSATLCSVSVTVDP
ncbi:MAG: S8 family serine peptidase, partial [Verrucomicrobiota bacterium]